MNESLSRQTIQVVAQRVAANGKRQRLSLDQLAARAGVSKGSLSGLEKGTGNPSIALLRQTASALGVSVSGLLDMSASRDAETFALKGGEVLWRGHGLFLETDMPHVYYCAGRQPSRFRMIVFDSPGNWNQVRGPKPSR
jgi:transcriptional regulator with XRE-family HTH domain